jgi:hypothetical protein
MPNSGPNRHVGDFFLHSRRELRILSEASFFSPLPQMVDLTSWRYSRSVGEQVIRFAASRSLRNWGAALVALWAGVLLSPRPTEAGCGDYVWIRGQPAAMAHSMPGQAASPGGTSNDAAEHGAPHRPCQGPGCSDGSFPPQAPAPGVVVSIDRWAMAPGEMLPESSCCSTLLAESCDLVAIEFRLSILRPPR